MAIEQIITEDTATKTMEKSKIKDFAVKARAELIAKITLKCTQLGIEAGKEPQAPEHESSDGFVLNGQTFNKEVKEQRTKLIAKIKDTSFEHVIDEVSYTWFNRFVALYFMEVHNYLNHDLKIISSIDNINSIALKAPNYLDKLNKEELFNLVQDSKDEDVYKKLIIAQCNALYSQLPFMFEKINDYTELLFPTGLLNQGSVIRQMLEIQRDNWNEVEIIGWLYQYYNLEEKNRVINAKKRYQIDEIPYATQLFTPKWIVKYMTQNSLGRLWQEANPNSKLKESMEFYLEPRNLTEEDKQALIPYINKGIRPEEIKVFDPACGSAHILVYAYDVLFQIYKESGYLEEEVPELILKNNLYGLDICDRASQLAQFAILMKANADNKKILENKIELNVCSIQDTNNWTKEQIAFVAGEENGASFNKVRELIDLFKDAKIYGSLIKMSVSDFAFYQQRLQAIEGLASPNLFINSSEIYQAFKQIVKQAEILKNTYDVTITNPPYMGNKYMHAKLSEFIVKEYPDNKSDLFSAFMEFIPTCTKKTGHIALVTPFVWMFIKSYESLRKYIINSNTLSSLIQLEYNAFEAACVPVSTFTTRNYAISYPAECIKLSDFTGSENQPIKTKEAIEKPNADYRYTTYSKDFHSIPGSPIAYWASDRVREIFKNERSLSAVCKPTQGLATADNDRFLRLWTEVDFYAVGLGFKNTVESKESGLKWFPYNKGGEFRKWYGNNEYLVNWLNDGYEIKNFTDLKGKQLSRPQNTQYYFQESMTWSFISSASFGVRYSPAGAVFDVGGSSAFTSSDKIKYITGILCSKICFEFLKLLNPTLNFQVGNVGTLSIIFPKKESIKLNVEDLVEQNIQISKTDWDSFETSWDFEEHPLIRHCERSEADNKIEKAFKNWSEFCEKQFNQLK